MSFKVRFSFPLLRNSVALFKGRCCFLFHMSQTKCGCLDTRICFLKSVLLACLPLWVFWALMDDLTFCSGTRRRWPGQPPGPFLTNNPTALYRPLPKDEPTGPTLLCYSAGFSSRKVEKERRSARRTSLLQATGFREQRSPTALDLFTEHHVSNSFPSEFSIEGETEEMLRKGWTVYPSPHLRATACGTLPSFLKCLQKHTVTTCGPYSTQQIILLKNQLCNFFKRFKL